MRKIPFQFTLYFLDVFYSSAIVYVGESDEERKITSHGDTGGCFHLQKTGEQTNFCFHRISSLSAKLFFCFRFRFDSLKK